MTPRYGICGQGDESPPAPHIGKAAPTLGAPNKGVAVMKEKFGKNFARAMAAAATAGVGAGAAAATARFGVAGEAQHGTSGFTISSGGGSARVSVEGIGAEPGTVSGVVIVGQTVWIDGTELDPGVSTYTGTSGRKYRIQREGGRVSVISE